MQYSIHQVTSLHHGATDWGFTNVHLVYVAYGPSTLSVFEQPRFTRLESIPKDAVAEMSINNDQTDEMIIIKQNRIKNSLRTYVKTIPIEKWQLPTARLNNTPAPICDGRNSHHRGSNTYPM